jgi:ribosomal protein L24, bacterial/organelle
MAIKLQVKKGDEVQVIAGQDKGKKGKIVRAFPRVNKVLIDGVNVHKKHIKKGRGNNKKGEVVDKAMPIHASNVKKI